jgi:hypothetical protein
MEKAPRNKMITTSQEETKQEKPRKKKRFFFPQHQKSVEAETREEAEKIINK